MSLSPKDRLPSTPTKDKISKHTKIAKSDIPADIDVPLDWLYKGKRKTKAKTQQLSSPKVSRTNTNRSSSNSNINKPTNNENSRSLSNSSNKLSRTQSITNGMIAKPNLNVTTNSINSSNDTGKDTSMLDKNASPFGTARRQRSSSIAVSSIPIRTPNKQPNSNKASSPQSSLLSPSSSSNQRNSTPSSTLSSPLKRSVSLSEKPPKKSLLGSIFGRKHSQSKSNKMNSLEPSSPQSPNRNNRSHSSSSADTNNNNNTINELQPVTMDKFNEQIMLNDLKEMSLKRVRFAVDKFNDDPPQQLPSRKPKLGNILIPEDMVAEIPSISVGITISDNSNSGGKPPLSANKSSVYTKDSKEYKLAVANFLKTQKEAMKHQQEAHRLAEELAHEVNHYRPRSSSLSAVSKVAAKTLTGQLLKEPNKNNNNNNYNNNYVDECKEDVDTNVDIKASSLSIDKPIHLNEHPFDSKEESKTQDSSQKENTKTQSSEITLDLVYTRCCHLREILPIPSTLRQVKGKTAPLQTLKFLNPRPTLIDILSFCDFISIIPIHNIIFDNVLLTSDMLRIILSSLVDSITLEKLGLRNVIIDEEDWKFFCKFLLDNKSVTKLDISQTKLRSDMDESLSRENMDWPLFCQVLRVRKGEPLEELLLNGVKFNRVPLGQFYDILHVFGKMNRSSTSLRLGLATSDISVGCLKVVFDWMSKYNVQGVDLAFNNLDQLVPIMVDKLSDLTFKNLQYFTLNSTNISSIDEMASMLERLSLLPNLKFLDLSNLPQLFPGLVPYLHKYLPRFLHLKRIHFDNNDLTYKEIAMLCNILIKCKNISHVSLLSQNPVLPEKDTIITTNKAEESLLMDTAIREEEKKEPDTGKAKVLFSRYTLWATLYGLVKDSPNLVSLDIDYDKMPEEMRSRIVLGLMRNMQSVMDSNFTLDEKLLQDNLLFDGSLLSESAESLLKRLNSNSVIDVVDPTKKYLLTKYLEKLETLHLNVQNTIDSMFEKRKSGELPLEEKENLLRLLLLEKNLSNILELFSKIPSLSTVFASTSPSLNTTAQPTNATSITAEESPLQSRPILKHMDSGKLLQAAIVPPPENGNDNDVQTRPHLIATESGRIIDTLTGKAILHKSLSNTSLYSKKQEEEEGELHKWGYFIQQQYQPQQSASSSEQSNYEEGSASPLSPSDVNDQEQVKIEPLNILPKIPSGSQLREAIIQAKGINSIDDLIRNVSKNRVEVRNVYDDVVPISSHATEHHPRTVAGANITVDNDEDVIEKYDELLNNLSTVRASKV
ncbi:Her1p NDAI_0E01360 [Naumovozyma dairenensis CBS 421]|uniref:GLC7-interacting protein 3 n=1 Tax=Naumovozyma dairenensis (strain ATCC 10597 / BCRC 20456 / CBS 421 / NBRC 0211 / NRRL Y-12639) TaxID=1071378 RepID=G0WB32_NAUDC|nr:hypothetical protein NDAI_0E01360 [Naumovozyma dairenensis CBS 421]CCD24952.1 hypothetical protein NDAI_0E01360 [Naumovozyma dairenensis CBS 421]